jgi:decaprenyl-phosphate phosphoribosyltransferase
VRVVPSRPKTPVRSTIVAVASERSAAVEMPRSSLLLALLRTARPKQWVKNLLVVAAPGAAGVLLEPGAIWRTAVAFVALCLAASGTYFLNDALDVEADRAHPTKRNRPVASGLVSVGLAKTMAVVLLVAGIGVAAPVNGGQLAAVVGGYAALTVSYSLWLKHEPVLDLGAVAAGFVLRAVAGGIATNVAISNWFLIVAGAASLFIVAGKRYAELVELGDDSGSHRATLDEYTTGFLGFVRSVSASVTITAYCLWAFEEAARVGDVVWFRASIIPFVLVMLRYAYIVESGGGGAPEDVVFEDRVVQILGVLWLVTFALGVIS